MHLGCGLANRSHALASPRVLAGVYKESRNSSPSRARFLALARTQAAASLGMTTFPEVFSGGAQAGDPLTRRRAAAGCVP
jgi:hypothetical protein